MMEKAKLAYKSSISQFWVVRLSLAWSFYLVVSLADSLSWSISLHEEPAFCYRTTNLYKAANWIIQLNYSI